MAFAFVLLFIGAVLVYEGIANDSLQGILSGKSQPISNPVNTSAFQTTGAASTLGGSTPLSGISLNPAGYINPLHFVNNWERTDQGVDANLPVGAPILAPSAIKIMGVVPDWYNGQPMIWWQLLTGANAGQYQYVAEQISNLAQPGTELQQGQPIADYASSGTGIEFGWATASGETLARATTGYSEGQITPAGSAMRAWLNALGAGAGPDHG